jgi:hypothetical protein
MRVFKWFIGITIMAMLALAPVYGQGPPTPPKCESYCLDMKPELLSKAVALLKAGFPDDNFKYVLGGYLLVNKNETEKGNLLLVVVVHSGVDAVRYFIVVRGFQVESVAKEGLLHTWDVNLKRWL